MSSPDPDATDSSGDEHEAPQRNGAVKSAKLNGTVAVASAVDGMPALQSMAEVAGAPEHAAVVMATTGAHVPLHKAHSTGMVTLAVPITAATVIGGGRPPVSPQRAHVLRTPSPNAQLAAGRRSPSQSPSGGQPQRSPNGSPLSGMSLNQGSRSNSPGVVTASIVDEPTNQSRPVIALAVPISAQQLGPQTHRSENPQIVMASVSLPPPPRSHKKAPSIGSSPQGSPTHRPASSNNNSGSGNKKRNSSSNHAAGDQSDGSERAPAPSPTIAAAAATASVFNEDVDALMQLAMFSTEATDDSALKKSGSAPIMSATAALLASDKKRKSKAIADGTSPAVAQPVVASIIPSPTSSTAVSSALHAAAAAHSNMLPSIKKQKLGLPMAKSVSGGGGSTPSLSPTLAAAVPSNGLKKEGGLALVSPATIVQGQQLLQGVKKATKIEGSPLKGPMLANAMPTVMASAVYEGNGVLPMQMHQQHPQQFEMMGPNGPYMQQQQFVDPMQGYGGGGVDPRMHPMMSGPYGPNGMMMPQQHPGQFGPGMMQNYQFGPFPPQQQQPGQPGQPTMAQQAGVVGPNGQPQFLMNGSVGSMQSNSVGGPQQQQQQQQQQQMANGGMFPGSGGSFYGPNGQLMSAGPAGMMMGPGGFMSTQPPQMGPMGGYGGGPLGHMQMQMQMQPQQQQQLMGGFSQQQQPSPHMMMHPAQPLMQMPMLGTSLSPSNKRCARHVEIAYYIHMQKAQAQTGAAAVTATPAVPSTDGAQPMAGVTTSAALLPTTSGAEIQPEQNGATTAAAATESSTTSTVVPATATTIPAASTTTTSTAATASDAVAASTTSPALTSSTAPALATTTAVAAQPGTGSPPMLTGVPPLAQQQQQQMPHMQLQPVNPMQMQMQQPGMPLSMSMTMPMQMQPGFPDPTLEARRLKQQRDWMRQGAPSMSPPPFGVSGVGGDLAYQQHLLNMQQQGYPMQGAGMPNGGMMLNGGLPGPMPGGPMMGPGGRFLPGMGGAGPMGQQQPPPPLMQGMVGPGQFVPQGGNWPPPQSAGGMQQPGMQPGMMEYMLQQQQQQPGGMQMHPSMAAMQQQPFNPHMQQQQPPPLQHPGLMSATAPLQQQQMAPLSASIVPLPPNTAAASLAPSSSAAAVASSGTAPSLAGSPPAATPVATLSDAPVALALSLPLAGSTPETVVAASSSSAPTAPASAAGVVAVPVAPSAPAADAAPATLLPSVPITLVGSA